MKFRINLHAAVIIISIFTSVMLLSSCTNDDNKKSYEGYTGKITDPRADSLVKRCHFLSKDSIEQWVGRYDAFKKDLRENRDNRMDSKDTMNAKANEMKAAMDNMSASFLMGGSISYNSCIIKKIIYDKNSIGLRVLYGIGSDKRIHIILVGIQPDYSNLYVDGEDCCDKSINKTMGAGVSGAGGTPGGAEYGQMP